jgi:hypothetical protein
MRRSISCEWNHVDELHIPLAAISDSDSSDALGVRPNSALGETPAARRSSSRNDQLIRDRLAVNKRA